MEVKEWKAAEKRRLTTNIGVDAFERLRWECYKTRKDLGHVITDLVNEHLEDPPPIEEEE